MATAAKQAAGDDSPRSPRPDLSRSRRQGQGIVLAALPAEVSAELRDIDADNSGEISISELRLAVRAFVESKKKVALYSKLAVAGLVLFCVMTIVQFGVMCVGVVLHARATLRLC